MGAALKRTYHGDDVLLDDGGERNQLEVEGKVELRHDCAGAHGWLATVQWGCRGGRRLAYRAHKEREGDGLLRARHGWWRETSTGRVRDTTGGNLWSRRGLTITTGRWVNYGGGGCNATDGRDTFHEL